MTGLGWEYRGMTGDSIALTGVSGTIGTGGSIVVLVLSSDGVGASSLGSLMDSAGKFDSSCAFWESAPSDSSSSRSSIVEKSGMGRVLGAVGCSLVYIGSGVSICSSRSFLIGSAVRVWVVEVEGDGE